MTLPFEKPFENSNAKRMWTCFVCGIEHDSFNKYQEHIIEKHDEGRDYVKCPLPRCQAPVRCVSSHFKIKHPTEPIPKGCQMKAIVWRDQKDPKGKKKRKVAFHDGDFVSEKNGKKLHYRSGYELEVYKILEAKKDVVRFHAEPFGIPYWFMGEQKNYFPDLMVEHADGRVEVWEIKPKSQTSYEVNDAKWTAADRYCEARGWHFEVKTEQGIKQLRNQL